jgi:hypothetical protein
MTPCPLCRTQLDATHTRCPNCGAVVRRDAPVPPPAWSTPAPAAVPAAAPPPPPTRPPLPSPAFAGTSAHAGGPVYGGSVNASPYLAPSAMPDWLPPATRPKQRKARRLVGTTLAIIGGALAVLFVVGLVAGFLDDRQAGDKIDAYVDGNGGEAYVSPDGGFTASFPTHPVPVDQTIQADDGSTLVFHDVVSRPGRNYAFEVGYFDLGNQVSLPDPHAALVGMVDAMATQLKGRTTATAPATFHGAMAETFTVEFKDKGHDATGVGVVALRGRRLYLVAVTARSAEQAALDRLVKSFTFNGPASS